LLHLTGCFQAHTFPVLGRHLAKRRSVGVHNSRALFGRRLHIYIKAWRAAWITIYRSQRQANIIIKNHPWQNREMGFYLRSDYWVNDKAVNSISTNPEK
jgi:hypothetical protein